MLRGRWWISTAAFLRLMHLAGSYQKNEATSAETNGEMTEPVADAA
jgi:hypothetical protein